MWWAILKKHFIQEVLLLIVNTFEDAHKIVHHSQMGTILIMEAHLPDHYLLKQVGLFDEAYIFLSFFFWVLLFLFAWFIIIGELLYGVSTKLCYLKKAAQFVDNVQVPHEITTYYWIKRYSFV